MNRDLKIWLKNLEKQMINLAKRQDHKANKNESGISETKAFIEEVEKENAENLLSMVEAMLEMSVEIEDVKGD